MRKALAIFLFLLISPLLFSSAVFAKDAPKTTTLKADQTINRDYFAGSDRVIVSGTVNGDAYLAGGEVSFDGSTSSDLLLAGGNITISGDIKGNVRVAGGNINFSGAKIGGNVTVFGGSVNVDPSTTITGSVVAAGGNMEFMGPVGKSLTVAGGNVVVGGDIGRDIWSPGVGSLRLSKAANVHGTMTYTSNEKAVIAQGATVSGKVTQKTPPVKASNAAKNITSGLLGILIFVWIADFIISAIIGAVLLFFLPNYTLRVSNMITGNPRTSFIIGLLFAILIPVVLFAMLFTVVGIPLSFAFFVIFVLAIWLSKIIASYAIGQKLLGGKANKYGSLLLGLAIYFVLSLVPVLGRLVQLAISFTGFGAFVITKKNYYNELRTKKII